MRIQEEIRILLKAFKYGKNKIDLLISTYLSMYYTQIFVIGIRLQFSNLFGYIIYFDFLNWTNPMPRMEVIFCSF